MYNEGMLKLLLWFLTAFFLAVVVQILVVYLLIENRFLIRSVEAKIELRCEGASGGVVP